LTIKKKIKSCQTILEDDETKSQIVESQASLEVIEEELKKFSEVVFPAQAECHHVCPVFDVEGPSASNYLFTNDNKTIQQKSHSNPLFFSTVSGKNPLPSSGQCEFSVSLDNCAKAHPKLYIGITTSELKGKSIAYKPGYCFLSTFRSQSYLGGLRNVKEDAFPSRGQVVTVRIDLDCGKISFEVDEIVVLEGKLNLSKTKASELYPFVCLGEPEGSVSFV